MAVKPAFVVPFYGPEIGGGAETLCRRLAENLALRGIDVEVLTTTIKGLQSSWNESYHEPGIYDVNGVTVRRFAPRPMNPDIFIPMNNQLIAGEKLSLQSEVEFSNQFVNSDTLFEYVGNNAGNRLYFFLPYLFGLSLNGTAIAPHRSFLIPCLHDEGYAAMRVTEKMFHRVGAALFLSNAEMELAKKLYGGLKHTSSFNLGCGVDKLLSSDAKSFREKHDLGDDPFILYVGRRSPEKNVGLLVDFFARYKRENRESRLKLVFVGPGKFPIPDDVANDVIDAGFVSVEEKHDGLTAATLLIQPSLMESFSIVMMESWLAGRPVMVHKRCAVTKEHVLNAGGGFAFSEFDTFCHQLETILTDDTLADEMGGRGREYVKQNYSWHAVTSRFVNFLNAVNG